MANKVSRYQALSLTPQCHVITFFPFFFPFSPSSLSPTETTTTVPPLATTPRHHHQLRHATTIIDRHHCVVQPLLLLPFFPLSNKKQHHRATWKDSIHQFVTSLIHPEIEVLLPFSIFLYTKHYTLHFVPFFFFAYYCYSTLCLYSCFCCSLVVALN